MSKQCALIRAAVLAGIAGPLVLGTSIVILSFAQYGFMRRLGWHPLRAPTLDWPSGLALGPYGRALSVSFVLCGLALPVFAAGLATALDGDHNRGPTLKAGHASLILAGIALVVLASDTDPTFSEEPTTWHGGLHDAAFTLLGLALMPALILLGLRMIRDPTWRSHGFYTLSTVVFATGGFLLRGVAFYLFLGAVLCWFVVTALKLRNSGA